MEITEKPANTLDCELGDTVNRVCLYWIEAIRSQVAYRLSAAMSLLF
jgi:hypothetical protein